MKENHKKQNCETCKHRLTNENLDDYCELHIKTKKKYHDYEPLGEYER